MTTTRPKKNKIFVCGTREGYEGHLRRGERPCNNCLIGGDTYSDDEIRVLISGLRDKSRNQQLWNSYGISLATFERILAQQNHQCACCSTTSPGLSWHVDLDHDTGTIRGILCSNCNTGIRMLGDDLEGVLRAATYLEAHAARGGHPRDLAPPKATLPKISKGMQRCFDLFTQGTPRTTVVTMMRLTPEVVNDIYTLWKGGGGVVKSINRHWFSIPKDSPQRVACTCGFARLYDDQDSRLTAVEQVNAHIAAVDSNREAKEANGQAYGE